MFKFKYNLPNFCIVVFLLGASVYDLFIVGSFYEDSSIEKVKDIGFLVFIVLLFVLFIYNYSLQKQH